MIEKEKEGFKFKIEIDEKISSRIGLISYTTSEPMIHSMTPNLLEELFCKKEEAKEGEENKKKDEISVLIDGRCAKYDIIIGYGKGLHVIGDSISEEYEILDILSKHLSSLTEIDNTTKIVYMVSDKSISIEELKTAVNKYMDDETIEVFNVNVLVNVLSTNGDGYEEIHKSTAVQ